MAFMFHRVLENTVLYLESIGTYLSFCAQAGLSLNGQYNCGDAVNDHNDFNEHLGGICVVQLQVMCRVGLVVFERTCTLFLCYFLASEGIS